MLFLWIVVASGIYSFIAAMGIGSNDAANANAAAALAKANDAYNLATNAREIASEASYAAEQAQNTADAAMECCNENSQKLDRMFEKAMMK